MTQTADPESSRVLYDVTEVEQLVKDIIAAVESRKTAVDSWFNTGLNEAVEAIKSVAKERGVTLPLS